MVTSPNTFTNTMQVFDRKGVRLTRNRAAADFQNYDFLFGWAGAQILERLSLINRSFDRVLNLGLRVSDDYLEALQNSDQIKDVSFLDMSDTFARSFKTKHPALSICCADEEFLPIQHQSLNLVVAPLTLHTINDLPGAFHQIKNTLKPDGLFLGCMIGGESLKELRACLLDAELEITGGTSPRVAPFADKQDMGALMQRANFALPVVDSERLTVTYDNAFKLMADLRGMGENNMIHTRAKSIPKRQIFFKTAELYQNRFAENDGRIVATFEIIFCLGWAPHESQQKPLQPGSAEHRLADTLGTQEIKTEN